ncbi:hypothetical protein EGD76_21770 [Escherichia coli]|nr:hypothetical protein [Escherichia coli]EFN7764804.1 hypothetical protein [Escherichia coli]MHU83333.1 hypothetical protein [Escherichia coli]HAJ7019806.1 hypothetical protein [Escherichia coli]
MIRPYQSPLVVSLTNLTKPAMLICMSFFNTLSLRLRFCFGLWLNLSQTGRLDDFQYLFRLAPSSAISA